MSARIVNVLMRVVPIAVIAILSTNLLQAQENDILKDQLSIKIHGYTLVDEADFGYGFGLNIWYHPLDRVGIGPEVGYDVYDRYLNDRTLNLGLNARYELGSVFGHNPFISFGAGYSNPYFNTNDLVDIGVESKSGGVYIRPSLGLLVDLSEKLDLSVAFGFHKTSISFEALDFIGNTSSTSIDYNRYFLSIGVVF